MRDSLFHSKNLTNQQNRENSKKLSTSNPGLFFLVPKNLDDYNTFSNIAFTPL